MKVILTIDFSPWSDYSGGAQRSTHNLAQALSRRGHDVTVIYSKPPWERIDVPGDLLYQVRWAVLPALRSRRAAFLRPLSAVSVTREVRVLLQPEADAVVHSNGEEGGLIYRLRPRYRFGFVATPRHPRYPKALLEKDARSPLSKLDLLLRHGKYLLQGSAVRHADFCCPPSAFAAGLVQRAFGVETARLRVVPNGVPEEFLCYERPQEFPRDAPLVFFGRFETSKGVDTLIDALGLLGPEAPPSLIVGRGEDRQRLEEQIAALHLSDRVRILPWMSHEALGDLLTRAAMAVLPSREENFSLAVLSAMAVGVPVVSTRVGGTPEIIEDGRTGVLVAPDAPRALAAAIRRVQLDPDLNRQIGRAGRARVRTRFTWDVAAQQFESLYAALLSAGR